LELGTDVFPAGVNGALHRTPHVDASALNLLERLSLIPEWKARRQKVETFGVTFPEGVLLLPPKTENDAQKKENLRRLDPPAPADAIPDPHGGPP
jgi:hypothetical protein